MKIFSKFYFISFFMFLFCGASFMYFLLNLNFNICYLYEIELLSLNSVSFSFIIYLDWMSFLFMVIVTFISSLILVYSKIYMGLECHRFLWITFMFIFFMLFMIMSPSVLGVLLGWDGLGVISYCLVIYYKSLDAFNSGFITAATNRLGDSMLILSITWFSMDNMFIWWEMGSGVAFFLVACMTKSAQFPFSAWLPSAMAAPTPISSLVHSSTLVTAGVYMLIRFYHLLLVNLLMEFLLVISLVTIFIAGMTALKEYDLKRIIALSTLGQLGFMMFTLSVGFPYVAFFHLLIHALFKALLFMCAGSVIHSGVGIQDLRKLGNINIDCFTKISLNIAVFNLMGLPFTSGFYSKDSLLELTNCSYGGVGVGLIIMIMVLITVSYSIRLMLFLSSFMGWVLWLENSANLKVSVLMLSVLNLMAGSSLNWLMQELELISLSLVIKLSPLIMILLGLCWHGVFMINVESMYMVSSLFFTSSLTKLFSVVGYLFFFFMKLVDQGWLESFLSWAKCFSIKNSFYIKNMLMPESKLVFSVGVTLSLLLVI
uniref:NADH-ubiquinone oxidoreductase chain 5 n=1 Tax=Bactericera cockerelli TaxID=290155 RepID=A0A1J0I0L8_9HEMI|nr:NADH dehydrogenase subunit 5 [Bactericera cockerelli]